MKREYIISIEGNGAHQPSPDEIFKAVRDLVDHRVSEFPKTGSGTDVSMMRRHRVPRQKPTHR